MGILLDKKPDLSPPVVEDKGPKPFPIFLEKYKSMVAITSLKVSETDETLLEIEFDHNIDAPHDEVQAEVGRVIIERLESGIALLQQSDLVVEDEKVDGEPV
jgi:hypothetical protein